ncbi:MAG TPA: 3'-5' exonuclease, partial [Syntrophorhabdaceae bacterium]|nr:3'-5' exonuclease [Syntrophorhabdaceae bacterium]
LRYDAILIDEGQDFSDDMYRVVAGLLNPATDNLTVAIDPTQGIYPGKGVGIVKKGKVHHITRVYRNTREITAFVAAFMGEERTEKKVDEGGGLFPALFESHGPRPSIKGLSSEARMIEYVADTVESLVRNDGFPSSEIAILYTSKTLKTGKGEINLPEELMAALDARGILSTWASEDYRAKKSYDITTDSVTISTIHSAKGLDYACVFLAGLDFLSEKMPEETMKNLTYVGLTRARYHLFIPHVRKTQLVERLLRAMQVERVKLS